MNARFFVHLIQKFPRQFRKDRCDILTAVFIFPDDLRKGVVQPEEMSLCVRDGIRHRHLIEELFLHPRILRRKLHQSAHQTFSPVHEQPECHQHIYNRKSGHHKTGSRAHNPNCQVRRQQEYRQYDRPLQIRPQLTSYFHIFFHLILPCIQCCCPCAGFQNTCHEQ